MTTGPDTMSVKDDISCMAKELADAGSRRDAEAAARYVRADNHVAYVSDGSVIRGNEYRSVLERFYAGMKRIDFQWKQTEIRVIDPHTGVVTGWASIALTDARGETTVERAVFTLVFACRDSEWELVSAHKTTVR